MQAHSFPYQYQRIHFQTGAPGLAVEVTLVPTEEDGLFCSACLLGGANPFAAEFGELGAELAGFFDWRIHHHTNCRFNKLAASRHTAFCSGYRGGNIFQ